MTSRPRPALGGPAGPPPRRVRGGGPPLIAIGASTGGVEALREVLAAFPANCPPTLIVQHMRARFVEGFVERLDRLCAPKVRPAAADARLEPGTIHIATGDTVHLVAMGLTQPRCALVEDGLVSGHRPSVDMLFRSLVPFAPSVVAALLTGMGRDGASGMLALRRAGAFTICQDQETSVVYGMPRAASEMGAVDRELPLDRIGMAILKASRRIAA